MGLSFIADYDSERVWRWGVFLNTVKLMGSMSDFLSYYAWTLMRYWLLFTFLLNKRCQGNHQIPNRVLHKRQRKLIDVIDRDVKIFLTTYFRTTPVSDISYVINNVRFVYGRLGDL